MCFQLISDDEWASAVQGAAELITSTGFPPAPDAQFLSMTSDEFFDDPEMGWPTSDSIEASIPAHDPTDPAARSVVANLLFALSEPITSMFESPGHAAAQKSVFLSVLRHYLAATAPTCPTLPLLRWELYAATAARGAGQVVEIAHRWSDVDPQGTFAFVVARALFLVTVRLERIAGLDPDIGNRPLKDDSTRNVFDLQTAILVGTATQLAAAEGHLFNTPDEHDRTNPFDYWRAQGADVDRWTSEPKAESVRVRKAALLECASLVDRMPQPELVERPYLAAIGAWCRSTIGRLESRPEQLVLAGLEFGTVADRLPRPLMLSAFDASTTCYVQAAHLPQAETVARRWVAAAPEDPNAHRRLTQILYKLDRADEAVKAFEDYVRYREEGPDSWMDSLILRLGLEAARGRLPAVLDQAADSSASRTAGMNLTTWLTPWFDALADDAKRRWWTGLFVVSSREMRAAVGEAAVWEQAADAFGETVSIQLRATVFRQFLDKWSPAPCDQLQFPWRSVCERRGTLGVLLDCLLQATRPHSPDARQLNGLLAARYQHLLRYLTATAPDRIKRLARLRGQAQHDKASEAEARVVYEEAARLLAALTASMKA